jgi:excisionase family DNA binding protein
MIYQNNIDYRIISPEEFQEYQTLKNQNMMPLFSSSYVQKYLDVSRKTLYRWREQGKIEFVQVGSKIYYTKEQIEKFLNKMTRRVNNEQSV